MFTGLGTVLACGGGGGGGAALQPDPQPIESLTKTIPVGGGTVGSAGNKVTFQATSLSLTSALGVKLDIYRPQDQPIPELGRSDSAPIGFTLDPNLVRPTGKLTITLPLDGTFDPEKDFVSLRAGDRILSKTPSFDDSGNRVQFVLTGKELRYLNAGTKTNTHHAVWATMPGWNVQPIGNSAKLYNWLGGASDADIAGEELKDDKVKAMRWLGPIDPAASPLVNAGRCAVVLHGMMNSKENMNSLAHFLFTLKTQSGNTYYHTVLAFDYDWLDNIADNGNRLSKMIYAIKTRQPNLAIDIYGHSMGGLVSRYAIQKGQLTNGGNSVGLGRNVDRLFTLGSPQTGVPIPMRDVAVRLIVSGDPLAKSIGWALIGANGVRDLERGRGFLTSLGDGKVSGNGKIRAHVVFAGESTSYKISIVELYPFVKALYDLTSPSDIPLDGIVPVRSARGEGLSAHAAEVYVVPTVPLNHSNVRGVYQTSGFNLDVGQPFGRQLRSYVLGLGQGEVIID